MNPSTAAARWRKLKKLLMQDAIDSFVDELVEADWLLANERGEGLVLAALDAKAPRCASWICENASPEQFSRVSFAGQTPFALACKNAQPERLGGEPALILLRRNVADLLAVDSAGASAAALCAQAQSWGLLQQIAQAAQTLSPEQRILVFWGTDSAVGAVSLAVRHQAPVELIEHLLGLFPQLHPEQALSLLREAAWSGNADCVPLVFSRIAVSNLPSLKESIVPVAVPPVLPAADAQDDPLGEIPFDHETSSDVGIPIGAAGATGDVRKQPDELPIGLAPEIETLSVSLVVTGRDPLLLAFRRGHMHVVQALLAGSMRVDHVDAMGRGVLHAAVLARNLELMKLAIASGADVNLRDSLGLTPFLLASVHFCEPEAFELLREARADLWALSSRERGAVDLACSEGSLRGLTWLLDQKLPARRSPTQAFGPIEHALCSPTDACEKVALLVSKGIRLSLAHSSCFLNPASAARESGSLPPPAFGEEMIWRWTSSQSQMEKLRRTLKTQEHFDISNPLCSGSTSLAAAVCAPSDGPLKWLLATHESSFSHWDYLGAWLRAVRHGIAGRLSLIETAWLAREHSEPLSANEVERAGWLKWIPSSFFIDKNTTLDQLEETGLIALNIGQQVLPPVRALRESAWAVFFGAFYLRSTASSTRAALARRVNWVVSGFWGRLPESQSMDWIDLESALTDFGINESRQHWSGRVNGMAEFLKEAGREELVQLLDAAQASPFPVRSLWTFSCALTQAHTHQPPKHVLILVRKACEALSRLAMIRSQTCHNQGQMVYRVGPWQEQLALLLHEESTILFEALSPALQGKWRTPKKGERVPDVFQASPWRNACTALSVEWLKTLATLGFPGRVDHQSLLNSALWCAKKWSNQREKRLDTQERLLLDSRLVACFESIAQTEAQSSFSAADNQGCGPLFFCFEPRAWEIARAHGARVVLAPVSDNGKEPPAEPTAGPTVLSALISAHPLDQLPAGSFRAASTARGPNDTPLLGIRDANGELPFARAFLRHNLTRESQRRLASLWAPTVATGLVNPAEASALFARALGDGFTDVARVMFEQGVRLNGGGAVLTGSILRLSDRAENVLLSGRGQANPGAKEQSMPSNSRLLLIAQEVRALGMDPFEPVELHGRVGSPGADYYPGATPLLAALALGQFQLALALLKMGARPQSSMPVASLSSIHRIYAHWWPASMKKVMDKLSEDTAIPAFAAFCIGSASLSHHGPLVMQTMEALHEAGLDFSERLNEHATIECLRHQPTWFALAERLSLKEWAPALAPSTPKSRHRRL